jgi:hypothetical protein
MTHIMKTLYKFFKTAEVSQESPIYQKIKVEKYNLVSSKNKLRVFRKDLTKLKICFSNCVRSGSSAG